MFIKAVGHSICKEPQFTEIFIVCPSPLPQNPMVADLNPRGVSPPGYRGRNLCPKLSPGILATYPSRWTAATEWISKSRGSINISQDHFKRPRMASCLPNLWENARVWTEGQLGGNFNVWAYNKPDMACAAITLSAGRNSEGLCATGSFIRGCPHIVGGRVIQMLTIADKGGR